MTILARTEDNTLLAWHFLRPGNKLRDGRDAPPDGVTLHQDDTIVPCYNGLHGSRLPMDALKYHHGLSRGPICRVELSGVVVPHGNDKHAASERTILWRLDGETTDRVLHEFTRWCPLQVIHLWDAPDVVQRWLETGDESLRDAAWAAARVATRDTTRDAARVAAWAAARVAAGPAAWDAAGPAAWDAAWYAARPAARDAAQNAQNAHLERLFIEAHERSMAA